MRKLLFIAVLFLFFVNSTLVNAKTYPTPDPAEYQTGITWFDAVNKASSSTGFKGFAGVGRVTMGVFSFGVSEIIRHDLPYTLESIGEDNVLFKNYRLTWNVPPYATKWGDGLIAYPERALENYCLSKNAKFVQHQNNKEIWYCDLNGSFLVAIRFGKWPGADGGDYLTVIEPLNATTDSIEDFTNRLSAFGFQSAQNMTREQAREEEDRAMKASAWLAKQQLETPQRRLVGSKLCRESEGWLLVGFVEAKSPDIDKVQIRVVAQTTKSNRNASAGGFKETIVWDDPDNWYLCD